jgi:hypothetical protein
MRIRQAVLGGALCVVLPATAQAQVDQEKAKQYFAEAARACERDGGSLWGVSLCGPMIFADAVTATMAASQAVPADPKPRTLGFANTAVDWGGVRWATFIWQLVPADSGPDRARLMIHELFHRVQPQLGLLITALPGENDHLDTLEGRYLMQLEWRALAAALTSSGDARKAALADALAFRAARRARFPDAAARERPSEINEGLAQYTATVIVAGTPDRAAADAAAQLQAAPDKPSFVRTFAYPSGTAYGVLLDTVAPGWPRHVRATDDLADMLAAASGVRPAADADAAAGRYGGAELHAAETRRDEEHRALVAALRAKFVDGPVLQMPRGRGASFITTGLTPIPDAGTVYHSYRVTGEWGRLEADEVLVSTDGSTLTVPGPFTADGATLRGEGWTVTLADGWTTAPGPRAGSFQIVRR